MNLTAFILSLGTGSHDFVVDGVPFKLYYDEAQALGDNGKPVKGDKTGEYELFVKPSVEATLGFTEITRVHVSPHGTGKHGNSEAPRYAAEQVAEAIEGAVSRRTAATA